MLNETALFAAKAVTAITTIGFGVIRTGWYLIAQSDVPGTLPEFAGEISIVTVGGAVGWYLLSRQDKQQAAHREDVKAHKEELKQVMAECERRTEEREAEARETARELSAVIRENTATMARFVSKHEGKEAQ